MKFSKIRPSKIHLCNLQTRRSNIKFNLKNSEFRNFPEKKLGEISTTNGTQFNPQFQGKLNRKERERERP